MELFKIHSHSELLQRYVGKVAVIGQEILTPRHSQNLANFIAFALSKTRMR